MKILKVFLVLNNTTHYDHLLCIKYQNIFKNNTFENIKIQWAHYKKLTIFV